MKDLIKDYLTLSRNEQRGLAVFLILFTISLVVRYSLLSKVPGREFDHEKFKMEAEHFLAEVRRQDSLAKATNPRNESSGPNYARPLATWQGSRFSKRETIGDTLREKSSANYPKKAKIVVELNGADSAVLTTLDGIGAYYSSRIIKYRDLLGGFYSKEQLREIKGMDSIRYDGISAWVIADTSKIRKMDLNTITFKEMLRHPYFEYNLVKAIFQKRDKIKRYDSVGQLKELEIVYEDLFVKIRPYLEVRKDSAEIHDGS
jgi:DNA uptake protein ComE-like DNA-binding protein